uniref:tetratricopeptide repeat protein n=1 Tax=Clostridium perfringens TaxID=1502 RepID=UPI0039E8373B
MKNSKEALEVVYNNALDLILNKKLKEGEKLLEKIHSSGNINIDILNLLGIIKYMYCDFYGAKKYWNESLKISYEDNKASEFIEDIESDDFKLISEKYKDSISLIEDKNYLQAIENLEEVNKRRSELIEVKIILALLYMTIDEKNKAFKNIESALSYDTSNYKIKEIYDEIKCDLSKGQDEEKEESEELTFSQSILNLIMILNYRINSFYEEELKYRNEEIKFLYEEIKTMNLEIESLNTEKEKLSL